MLDHEDLTLTAYDIQLLVTGSCARCQILGRKEEGGMEGGGGGGGGAPQRCASVLNVKVWDSYFRFRSCVSAKSKEVIVAWHNDDCLVWFEPAPDGSARYCLPCLGVCSPVVSLFVFAAPLLFVCAAPLLEK